MKTDFLYYQRQLFIGKEDPMIIKYRPYIDEFNLFLKDSKANALIGLIIDSYKTEYAQDQFFWGGLYDVYCEDDDFKTPKHLGEMDWYRPEEMISREDLKAIIFYMQDRSPSTKNALLMKEMELQFKAVQSELVSTTHAHLEGLNYTSSINEGITVFTILDCPIAEIRISEKQFNFVTNPEYWKPYY